MYFIKSIGFFVILNKTIVQETPSKKYILRYWNNECTSAHRKKFEQIIILPRLQNIIKRWLKCVCNNTFAQVLRTNYLLQYWSIFPNTLKYKAQARGIEVTRKWRKVNKYFRYTYCIFTRREPLYWKLWKSYNLGI